MNDISESIQRLIDGELDDTKQIALFQALDEETPGHWRDLALGFVEAQMICEALPSACAVEHSKGTPFLRRMWSIAATLVLGLGLGLLVAPGPDTDTQLVDQPPTSSSSVPRYGMLNVGFGDSDLRTPILDGSAGQVNAGRALFAANEPMRRISEAYSEQGLHSTQSTTYLTADLDDGTQLVIPINYLGVRRPQEGINGEHSPNPN